MRAWIMTYYVTDKFGHMREREKVVGGPSLSINEARLRASKILGRIQQTGQPVYPQYDLVQEVRV